jgi:hypothetical protein
MNLLFEVPNFGPKHHRGVVLRVRQALAGGLSALFALTSVGSIPTVTQAKVRPVAAAIQPQGQADANDDGCTLKSARGDIKHVIYIQFDNVHFRRDNPNVPSDLEQMPHLRDFLTDNGTLLTNHHTPLISHTADDIVTSLTGVYGARHGIPVANAFGWFPLPGTSKFFDGFSSSFQYWTDVVNKTQDPNFFMITPDGKNAPAPWVPWTRAGCNVGAVSIANMELENVNGDLKTVFANNPNELAFALNEAKTNFDKAVADFEGIAIHCAAGNAVCSSANGGELDVLPQEPSGYNGFRALYGHTFVAPVISPNGPLKDLNGNLVTDNDIPAHIGFSGFGGISAAQTLAYVAAMQEHGVPVTYAYIADAHDNHTPQFSPDNPPDNLYGPTECTTDPEQGALGPGDGCYEAQLAAYDSAFAKFFARLASDGITKDNTLFVITSDENDHFAGGPASPANCDGIKVFCSYDKLGEIDANLASLLAQVDSNTTKTPFDIHFDMVPVFYLDGNPAVGSPVVREFERDSAKLKEVSVITGKVDQLTAALADPVELKLLHMITGDAQRTPNFVMFGNPDYFFTLGGPDAVEDSGFAWNHGGIQKEIVNTWLGLVGPGVKNKGVDDDVWSDHTDIRPTMLLLSGLHDDYVSDGRALVEELQKWAVPDAIRDSDGFVELARAYKQINAPTADLASTSLRISTRALASGSPDDDSTYTLLENKLANITSLRDDLAAKIIALLDNAEFHGKSISDQQQRELNAEAEGLLNIVHAIDGGK